MGIQHTVCMVFVNIAFFVLCGITLICSLIYLAKSCQWLRRRWESIACRGNVFDCVCPF